MAKRTHAEFLESGPPDRPLADDERDVQAGQCAHRINHAKTVVCRAMKLAAAFERQKSGRRRKTAREKKDEAALTRLDAEGRALKAIDLERAAEDHIHKTLSKIKSIFSSPALPPSVKPPTRAVVDTASLNVLARLYKATPVQSEMKILISDIQDILKVRTDTEAAPNGKAKAKKAERRVERPAERKPEVPQYDDISDEEEYSKYDSRIAASSDEDDTDVSEEGSEGLPASTGASNGDAYRRVLAPSPSSDATFEGFSDSENKALPSRSLKSVSSNETFQGFSESEAEAPPSKPLKSTLAKSTFVPSLTTGGYWSGSESEPESDIEVQPRKNRRGQRARQQLWEKKFGKEANHVQNDIGANRDKGWDLKRGAQEPGSRQRNSKHRHRESRVPKAFGSDANIVELKPQKPKKDDTGPLHPSWEAAKLAKEKKQTASFQGKKVVFD